MKLTPIQILLASAALILLQNGCNPPDPNEQVDEGRIEAGKYSSDEIGWTLLIPAGWDITDKEKIDQLEAEGHKAMNESSGLEFDISGLKNLVNFQKDRFNLFQSTSEPFESEYEGHWEENNRDLKELILQAYRANGMNVESTELSVETIDGLEFQTFSTKIYAQDGNLILTQIIYSRLINGYDFGVNINYNDEDLGEEMLAAWRASTFAR